MERGLQEANHYNQLAEWVQRVEACRKSGQKVSEWCTAQGIPLPTYYSWQRKVFQAVTTEAEVYVDQAAEEDDDSVVVAAHKRRGDFLPRPAKSLCKRQKPQV